MNRSEVEWLINENVIGRNAERDRKILHRRLIDGITYEKLSEEFGMSVRQIKNIVYKRQKQIF